MLISVVVIYLIVVFAARIFKSQQFCHQGSSRDRSDSEAILKERFARGEISQEEFVRMKQILSQS